jgi:electron transfer flavoprotein beta subunit
MIAGILGNNFINSCTGLTVEGTTVTAIRKWSDGGKETVSTSLPLIIESKELVEEKIYVFRTWGGIMTTREALTIVEPVDAQWILTVKFEKPAPRSAVKLISSDNLDELIDLLHNKQK